MSLSASTLFALRSLGRNRRRTFLSVAGVAVGVAISLVMTGFMDAAMEQWFDATAESGFGHVRIVPAEWDERRDDDLRLADWRSALTTARAARGVRVAAPHARTEALLAFGNRSVGVEMVGVDPEVEPGLTRFVRGENIRRGRYLRAGDRRCAVVGRAVAERLRADVSDSIVVATTDREGDIARDMFAIVGIAEVGNRDIESGICHVMMCDVEEMTGRAGAGDVTLLLERNDLAEAVKASLAPVLPEGDIAIGFDRMLPGLAQVSSSKRGYAGVVMGICIFVVVLGIVSSQVTAVLERRREFGVLAALGMRTGQFLRLLFTEAVAIGLAGAALGLLAGTPLVYYIATRGVDFSVVYDISQIDIGGIQMEPVFYGDIGWWVVPMALVVGLASTILASLYPAWLVTRIDPAATIKSLQ